MPIQSSVCRPSRQRLSSVAPASDASCASGVDLLAQRHQKGTPIQFLERLGKLDLLILDELGYIPFERRTSQLLFNFISNGYEHQSVMVKPNLGFGRWNEVFADDRLTAALIDRLVHHAHILAFTGQSYRYREAIRLREGDAVVISESRYLLCPHMGPQKVLTPDPR